MKKHLFSLLLAAFVTAGASAQENSTKLSVNVGPQWSSDLGVTAGVDVHIPFGQSHIGFEPGLYWSLRNTKEEHTKDNAKEECSDRLHYLEVPLRLTARVVGHDDSAFKMSLLFGPYFAYGLSGTSHYTVTNDGVTTKSEADAFGDQGRLTSRFDYGLSFGLNAVIKQHVKIGVFGEIGLKDIYRPNNIVEDLVGDLLGGITKTNIGGGITVGYQF